LNLKADQPPPIYLVVEYSAPYYADMSEKDANKEALQQVEKATESEPVKGEDLLESEDLKRKLADSKKRITADNTARPDKEALE
jgi:hypothetical protein